MTNDNITDNDDDLDYDDYDYSSTPPRNLNDVYTLCEKIREKISEEGSKATDRYVRLNRDTTIISFLLGVIISQLWKNGLGFW